MGDRLYRVPDCIQGVCDQKKYSKWLKAKAAAHVRRDRKRFKNAVCTVSAYKGAIHEAVTEGGHRDYYTGEVLDWSLISTYRNAAAVEGRVRYKKSFALLPTVDHTLDEQGKLKFVICSWRVNDMKNDMPDEELYKLCDQILKHRSARIAQ